MEQKPCGFQQVGLAPAVRIYDLYNPVLICAAQVLRALILHRPEEGGGLHSLLLCCDPDLRHKQLDVVNSSVWHMKETVVISEAYGVHLLAAPPTSGG